MSGYGVITDGRKLLAKTWTDGVHVEPHAVDQIKNIANMPFIHKHVAVMPDVHRGLGATIGTVIATRGAIMPAAVGVDIGCGVSASKTNLTSDDLPDNLPQFRSMVEAMIPHGRTHDGNENDVGKWIELSPEYFAEWIKLYPAYLAITQKHPAILHRFAGQQLGTLGSGNHFVEVCLDEGRNVWIMLHSGSRGAGNRIGTYFIERARQEMKRWYIDLPDMDLSYLPETSGLFDDYMNAVLWAQDYARVNRRLMMNAVFTALRSSVLKPVEIVDAIDCHHNYVSREHHFGENVLVTRKGALRARPGDRGVIPGSMGARSYIVVGQGNADSFCSCSHGAGRLMSRTEARKRFTLADHEAATAGVECRKDEGVLDETPGAYKPIEDVMRAQANLVQIEHTLTQVGGLCVKG